MCPPGCMPTASGDLNIRYFSSDILFTVITCSVESADRSIIARLFINEQAEQEYRSGVLGKVKKWDCYLTGYSAVRTLRRASRLTAVEKTSIHRITA